MRKLNFQIYIYIWNIIINNSGNLDRESKTTKASAAEAKTAAEAAKTTAETAKTSAETAKTSAEAAKVTAEAAKTTAEGARKSGESVKIVSDQAMTKVNRLGELTYRVFNCVFHNSLQPLPSLYR